MCFNQIALPLLRGGMVDFEDPKSRIRVTVGKRIEPCAKKNVLTNTFGDGDSERVLRVSASRNQKGAESNREGTVRPRGCAAELICIRIAQDRHSDRIIQYERLRIVELMCGASQSYAEGGARWNSRLHRYQV